MKITGTKEDKYFLFKISGRLDTQTFQDAENELTGWINDGEIVLVGDLTDLEFISSAGLRTLLLLVKLIKPKGGKIAVYGINASIKEVFDITGIPNVLPVADSLEEAQVLVK